MNTKSNHWGELDPSLGVGASVSLVTPSSTMTKSNQEVVIEGPKLTQPSTQQKTQTQDLPKELCRPDVLSLHTIQLLKYNHDLCTAVSSNHHGDSHKSDAEISALPSVPSLEELKQQHPTPENCKIDENGSLPRYSLNKGTVELDKPSARKLSYRTAATVCAHAGYDKSEDLALETLTDVLNDYLNRVCQLLRVAVDREATSGSTGFQDPLIQVLQEIGVGSPATLYHFWQKRIKNYHSVVLKRTMSLQNRIKRHKDSLSVTSKSSLASEDEMPAQIFAESGVKPPGGDLSNTSVSGGDGDEDGSWYRASVKSEPTDDSGGGERSDHDPGDEEVIESSSFTDSSSHVVDAGSTSPWDSYQDTPPPKKKKK